MPERLRTRFLVIGSGVAGLQTAWRASDHGDVVVMTKRTLKDSATAYAQGGGASCLRNTSRAHRIGCCTSSLVAAATGWPKERATPAVSTATDSAGRSAAQDRNPD